jgi:pimeloyl-ACP methyl ester carboxylesterase
MLEQLAAALGIKKGVMLWGALGALVSFNFAGHLPVVARVGYLCSGAACAWVGAPAVAEHFSLSDKAMLAVAFVIGVFGVNFLVKINDAIRETKLGEYLATWFKRPGA